VSGIQHGQRIGTGQQAVAGEVFGEIGARCFRAVEIDQVCGICVEADQIGVGQRSRMQPAVKAVRQARKRVFEIQLVEFSHGRNGVAPRERGATRVQQQ
jgi:hypothetical protein